MGLCRVGEAPAQVTSGSSEGGRVVQEEWDVSGVFSIKTLPLYLAHS